MAGTCSLVWRRTARAAASPTPLLVRPSEPVMSELREYAEPSGRAGTFGVDASWEGAGFSASQLLPAESVGLVLRGGRPGLRIVSEGLVIGDPIESDAFSAITFGARGRCPFGLVDPRTASGPMISS